MNAPFIIYGLGRCRTAWLSKFLTYKDWTCHHDQAIYLRSMEDARTFLSKPKTGTIETAAQQGRSLIRHYFPNIKEVVILRPIDEVLDSFLSTGINFNRTALQRILEYGQRELFKIANDPNVLVIDYCNLDYQKTCSDIFEHCLPYKFDKKWWESWRNKNIQIDIKAMASYFQAHRNEIEGFKRDCKSDMRRLYRAGELRKRVA